MQRFWFQSLNNASKNCSPNDLQTWLTTSLTNIETCKSGALELNAQDFNFIMHANVIEMIRNILAINMHFLKNNEETEEGSFPKWFSMHERKLLRSKSPVKYNLVAAKDGSGQYKTVQAALNSAAKRKYKTRFVIHVKKGVYRENIEVAVHNDNIMLVGDGMQNTIITSSRSVQGGFTTYSSATAGELYFISCFMFLL